MGPYCVLLVSIGLSLGGLIVGSTAVFIMHKANVKWYYEVRHLFVLDCQGDTAICPRFIHYHLGSTVLL